MEEEVHITTCITSSLCLWFLPYSDEEKKLMDADNTSGQVQVGISPGFDYEKPATNQWIIHIDVEMDFPFVAKTKTRTSFETNCPEEHLCTHEVLDVMNQKAIELCLAGFNKHCNDQNLAMEFLDNANFVKLAPLFSKKFFKTYKKRKPYNDVGLSEYNILHIVPQSSTSLVLRATFHIMDEILLFNKAFDLKHNREAFFAIIPEPVYYTVKFKCMEISKNEVQLVISHNVAFQTCLDCAIQMLMDRHISVYTGKRND